MEGWESLSEILFKQVIYILAMGLLIKYTKVIVAVFQDTMDNLHFSANEEQTLTQMCDNWNELIALVPDTYIFKK